MYHPKDLTYTSTHEWVKIKEESVTLGITDHAQSSMGDIVFVEFKPIGYAVTAGSVIAIVESVKAVFDIFSPIDGVITENNTVLEDQPELLNEAPYTNWICKIKKVSEKTVPFLSVSEYETTLSKEA